MANDEARRKIEFVESDIMLVQPKIHPLEEELFAKSNELHRETAEHQAAKKVRDEYRRENRATPAGGLSIQ